MKILLLSAYDAASHRVWREGVVRNLGGHRWTVLTLPPRFFAWRARGNPLTWAFAEQETLRRGYDLVLATSMTDLAELKGIVPSLAATPCLVYFHENQFAYPEQRERKEYQNYKLTNLYTALAADRVLFNSGFNMETFLEGAAGLLSVMPDHVPPGVVEAVRDRSEVLPVPLDDDLFSLRHGSSGEGPAVILWNHRWEHDKAPERFFGALFRLRERGVDFRVHVAGQQFRDQPAAFHEARARLSDHLLTWGYVQSTTEYRALIASSDIVVSSALHDFQGLAVLEGAAGGCLPLVPDRLAYRELFPAEYRYPSFEEDGEKEADVLADRLEELCRNPEEARRTRPPDLARLSWSNMAGRYEEAIKGATAQARA